MGARTVPPSRKSMVGLGEGDNAAPTSIARGQLGIAPNSETISGGINHNSSAAPSRQGHIIAAPRGCIPPKGTQVRREHDLEHHRERGDPPRGLHRSRKTVLPGGRRGGALRTAPKKFFGTPIVGPDRRAISVDRDRSSDCWVTTEGNADISPKTPWPRHAHSCWRDPRGSDPQFWRGRRRHAGRVAVFLARLRRTGRNRSAYNATQPRPKRPGRTSTGPRHSTSVILDNGPLPPCLEGPRKMCGTLAGAHPRTAACI